MKNKFQSYFENIFKEKEGGNQLPQRYARHRNEGHQRAGSDQGSVLAKGQRIRFGLESQESRKLAMM